MFKKLYKNIGLTQTKTREKGRDKDTNICKNREKRGTQQIAYKIE